MVQVSNASINLPGGHNVGYYGNGSYNVNLNLGSLLGFGGGGGSQPANYTGVTRAEDQTPTGMIQDALAYTIMAGSHPDRLNQALHNGPETSRDFFRNRPGLEEAVRELGGWDAVHYFPAPPAGALSPNPDNTPDPRFGGRWDDFPGRVVPPVGTMTVREYVSRFYDQAEAQLPGMDLEHTRQAVNGAFSEAGIQRGQFSPPPPPQQSGGQDRPNQPPRIPALSGLNDQTISLTAEGTLPAGEAYDTPEERIAAILQTGTINNGRGEPLSPSARGLMVLQQLTPDGDLPPEEALAQMTAGLAGIMANPELQGNARSAIASIRDEDIAALDDNTRQFITEARARALEDIGRSPSGPSQGPDGFFGMLIQLIAQVFIPDPEERAAFLTQMGFSQPETAADTPAAGADTVTGAGADTVTGAGADTVTGAGADTVTGAGADQPDPADSLRGAETPTTADVLGVLDSRGVDIDELTPQSVLNAAQVAAVHGVLNSDADYQAVLADVTGANPQEIQIVGLEAVIGQYLQTEQGQVFAQTPGVNLTDKQLSVGELVVLESMSPGVLAAFQNVQGGTDVAATAEFAAQNGGPNTIERTNAISV